MPSSLAKWDYTSVTLTELLTQPCIINCEPIKACYNGASLYASLLEDCRGPTLIENHEKSFSWLSSFPNENVIRPVMGPRYSRLSEEEP